MSGTNPREIRTVKGDRSYKRTKRLKGATGTTRRVVDRKVAGISIVTPEPAVARNLRSAVRQGNGRGGPDLRARLQKLSPAEPVAHLTPGKAVRITREFADLSQVELAQRADLTQGTLSAIESDKVTLGVERAKRLARALGVHPAALLFPDWPE